MTDTPDAVHESVERDFMGIEKKPASQSNPHLKRLAIARTLFAATGVIVLITAAQAPSQATGFAETETWVGWVLIGLAVVNAFIASAAKAVLWKLDSTPRDALPGDER